MTIESPDSLPEGESQDITAGGASGEGTAGPGKDDGGIPGGQGGVGIGADEEAVLRAYEAGADVCLTKPFRPRELSARIAAILRRPRTLIR